MHYRLRILIDALKPEKDPGWYGLRQHYKELWVNFFAPEARRLADLGIPVPSSHTPFLVVDETEGMHPILRGMYKKGECALVTYPTWTIPPHLVALVRPGVNYFLSGNEATINKAKELLKEGKLDILIRLHPGLWCNRDPYKLYKAMNHRSSKWPRLSQKIGDGDYSYSAVSLSPMIVERVEPLKIVNFAEQHSKILRRLSFVQGYISDCAPLSRSTGLAYPPKYYWDQPGREEEPERDGKPIYDPSYDQLLVELPLPDEILPPIYVTLHIIISPDNKLSASEELLEHLHHNVHHPIIFTLLHTADSDYFELSCAESDQEVVERQIKNYFPDFTILEAEAAPVQEQQLFILEAKPSTPYSEFKTGSDFHRDPLTQLFALLETLSDRETVSAYTYFAPLPEQTLLTIKAHLTPTSEWSDACKERIREIDRKLKSPPWLVGLRFTSTNREVLEKTQNSFLRQFETIKGTWQLSKINTTKVLPTAPPPWGVLNTDELLALVHFPSKDVQSERLEITSMKSKLPPAVYTEANPTAIAIGKAAHRGKTVTVTLPEQVRDRHVYIVGKSGMGKSTLITNMVAQDIQAGRGVAVVDPHGDLIDDILPYIPPERVADTILFNPSDKSHPVTLSPLACADEDEYEQVVSDLVATMNRLSETWGIQIDYLFRAIFNTLVRVPGATFIDVHDIIASEKRRDQILRQVSHPRVLNFWHEQFDSLLPKSARLPILTRMERIVDSPTLSRILSSAESSLNFTDVIENKKIFLARLAKGEIGEDNTKLLGSILTSQIQLAIMRRARIAKEQRTPFYLYVDEFQNFTTPTFETILSEARKYQLSLTFAHQFVTQLSDQMRAAILGNVSTVMMFTLDVSDARKLEGQLGAYTPDDVAQLPKHHLFCRPATSSQDTFPMETLAPLPKPAVNSTRAIIEHTRAIYTAAADSAQPEAETVKLQPTLPPFPPLTPSAAAPSLPHASQPGAAVRLLKAEPLDSLPTKEKILHYVQQAEYLATPHLHTLCFSHYANENSRKANASAMLKELIEAKQLKMQPFGRGNIYFTGRTPNPTAHNVAVRELFVRMVSAEFAIAELNFSYEHIPGLVPDLYVGFSAQGGGVVNTFWEYDTGTEAMTVIEQKLKRYKAVAFDRLVFVVPGDGRRQQLLRAMSELGVYVVQLDELTGLTESVFWAADQSEPRPLFEPQGE